jgi:hypothetical protein
MGAENVTPTGIRSPDRPARSESLPSALTILKLQHYSVLVAEDK